MSHEPPSDTAFEEALAAFTAARSKRHAEQYAFTCALILMRLARTEGCRVVLEHDASMPHELRITFERTELPAFLRARRPPLRVTARSVAPTPEEIQ